MPRLLFEYARLLRLPGLGGFSLAPVFGAISLMEIDVNIEFKDITLIFLIGLFSAIYSFVSNDIIDVEVDKLSKEPEKRPLVTGTISKQIALLISIICVVGAFTIVFTFYYRNQISFYLGLLCLILAAVFGTIYNVYGKKFATSAFLAALSEAFLVLVGAFMLSPDGTLSIFTWVIVVLMFNQILFMTAVLGGVKDADHDHLLNVKNLALASGVKVTKDKKLFIPMSFKAFALGIRFFSAFIVFVPFAFYGVEFEIWQILLLILFVAGILYLGVKLINIKTLERTDEIIKLVGLQGALRYSLIPILLIPVVGLLYAFILIIFPLVWYIISTPLCGKKLFRHLM
jgi:4-hydroxybenzoate polyprenyltransferase